MRSNESGGSTLDQYLRDINGVPLLTAGEERDLARRLRAGDECAGHRLVTANLRFVVKVAFEYRHPAAADRQGAALELRDPGPTRGRSLMRVPRCEGHRHGTLESRTEEMPTPHRRVRGCPVVSRGGERRGYDQPGFDAAPFAAESLPYHREAGHSRGFRMRSTSRRPEPATFRVEGAAVHLHGSWTVHQVGQVERRLGRVGWPGTDGVLIDATAVGAMDTAGAWLLCRSARALERDGHAVTLRLRREHEGLLGVVGPAMQAGPPPHQDRGRLVDALGRKAWGAASELGHLVRFAGETAVDALRALRGSHRERRRQVLQQVQTTGLEALPTAALVSFAVGAVIAYQAAALFRPLGAGLLVADLVGLAMVRDLAPLLAAIIAAARSGSAFAAQLGAMKVTGEIDSLRGVGVSPTEVLVLPRIAGLAVALPLLAVAADVLGVAGGMAVAHLELAIDPADFLGRVARTIHPAEYLVGLAKAPVFGVIVATIGCYQGLHVDEDVGSVGRRTTVAVVQSMFLVIVADGFVNVLSRSLGM